MSLLNNAIISYTNQGRIMNTTVCLCKAFIEVNGGYKTPSEKYINAPLTLKNVKIMILIWCQGYKVTVLTDYDYDYLVEYKVEGVNLPLTTFLTIYNIFTFYVPKL